MKKVILILGSLLIFAACESTVPIDPVKPVKPKQMVGGITEAKMGERGLKALHYLVKKEHYKGKDYTVVDYRTQIVAGTNYFFTISVGDQIYNHTVYEDLQGNYRIIN